MSTALILKIPFMKKNVEHSQAERIKNGLARNKVC